MRFCIYLFRCKVNNGDRRCSVGDMWAGFSRSTVQRYILMVIVVGLETGLAGVICSVIDGGP